MKKYRVVGKVVGTKFLGNIEAKNSSEAIEKAEEMEEAYIYFCHQCSSECEDPEITEFIVEEIPDEENRS